MNALRRAAPRGAKPIHEAAQRRTKATPSLGEGAGGRVLP